MGVLGRSLLFVLMLAPAALAAAPAKVQEKTPAGEAPASISVPEVATRAEEVTKSLRDLDVLLVPDPRIEVVRSSLPDMSARIAARLDETGRTLESLPALVVLDGLVESWQALRKQVAGGIDVLARRATTLEAALGQLTGLRQTWTQTRADAQASRAPAPVMRRIDAVLAAIGAARTRMEAERAAILVLQDRVAKEVARCEDALARVAAVREKAVGWLFVRESPPIWSADLWQRTAELPARVRSDAAAGLAEAWRFAQENMGRLVLQGGLFLGLALLLRAARQQARRLSPLDAGTAAAARVSDRPYAAALLLALLASFWIYPPMPRTVRAPLAIVSVFPAIRVMRHLLDPPFTSWLFPLAALFLVTGIRALGSGVPLLSQAIFLLEMLGGAAIASRLLGASLNQVRFFARFMLFSSAVSFVGGACGYMGMARLLGGGTLASAYLALVLDAGVRVADGLVAFALGARPLRLLGIVERHRALLEQRCSRLLRWLARVGWALATLAGFGLLVPFVAMIRRALVATLTWGSLSISLGEVLAFALTVWVTFLISAFLRFMLEEDVYPRLQLGPGLPYAISSLLHYVVLFAGFLLAVAALGLDLTKVTIIGGAFGVGIGFGLQNVVNNFVSGLIVLFERPIHVGDSIQIADVQGEVRRIGIRSSTVRTWEGPEVIVPNATLISDKVTNLTPADRVRRIDVPVGAAYGSPPEKVLDLLREVARTHPQVLSAPAPLALFLGFGESALRFELRAWTGRLERFPEIKSELGLAVYAALQAAGIEIPFPQREVRMRRESTGDA
jgi:small-conductance mechanosensitive channel